MSDKREFDGLVQDGYFGANLIIIRDGHLTHIDIRELLMGLEGKQVRVTIEPLPVAPETCHEEVIALVNSGMNEPAAPIPSCETCIHNMPDGDTLEDMGYKMQYCGHCTELPDRVSEWKPKPAPGPGASDSNDPEQERFKQKVKQFEEDCKRPRPDIAKAIQDEFKKRFREGST